MRIVVTGAAGFIGAHLTQSLVLHGHDVLPIDNFSSYYALDLKKLRVSDLISPLGLSVKVNDLSNISKTRELISEYEPDSIIHLAAQPGVRIPVQQYDS